MSEYNESIEWIEQMQRSLLQVPRKCGKTDYIIEMFSALCECKDAIKERNKYRWHNLIFYPNDLPDDEEEVEVLAKVFCPWDEAYRFYKMQMQYRYKELNGKRIGWGYGYPYNFDFEKDSVVAWKKMDVMNIAAEMKGWE